jgi:glucose-6-phosphate isomerase
MGALDLPHLLRVGADGELDGRTGVKRSLVADLAGLFADREAYDRLAADRPNDLVYEVREYRPDRIAPHELVFGTSTLQAGKVGDEFFMTRGHIHARADRPEIYFCQSGRGVMHMEAPDGTTKPVALSPGAVVYVPPYWIHRSVNVGEEPFITTFCYPADAGQNYGIIESSGGMRTLIVDDGAGGWAEVQNMRYRPRSPAEQRKCLAEAAA